MLSAIVIANQKVCYRGGIVGDGGSGAEIYGQVFFHVICGVVLEIDYIWLRGREGDCGAYESVVGWFECRYIGVGCGACAAAVGVPEVPCGFLAFDVAIDIQGCPSVEVALACQRRLEGNRFAGTDDSCEKQKHRREME